jgi:cytoskeletal protein CcmA (bactofilin family)
MWRKPDDPKAPSASEGPGTAATVPEKPRSIAGLTAEVVQPSGGVITSSLIIKGDISGAEDLYIDGEVRGSIQLKSGRVTVGPHGQILADVNAQEIVVRGKVKGSLHGRDRVEIGRTGEVRGEITTLRISIEDGATIHSKVEVTRAEKSPNLKVEKPQVAVATQALAMKAAGDMTA